MPKVSVVVPVYNAAATLRESLSSIFSQTLADLEVVAVNDASTDASGRILDQLASSEPRLRVFHQPENRGAHAARAVAVGAARGDYVGFLDADDRAHGSMFARLLDACVEHDADIAVCGADRVAPDGRFLGRKVHFEHEETVTTGVFHRFCASEFGTGSMWNKLYRRDLIRKHACMDLRWRQDASEDTIVNLGCFADASRVRLVSESLYQYVFGSRSVTRSVSNGEAFARMFRGYALAIDTYAGLGPEALAMITQLYSRQMAMGCYSVSWPEDLEAYESLIGEAAVVLAEKYPAGLAGLASRPAVRPRSLRSCLGNIRREFRMLPGLLGRAIFAGDGSPPRSEGE